MGATVTVPQEQSIPAYINGKAQIPPLQSGDRLTRAEFERRYRLHPEIKKAELIEGEVYVASPVHAKKHSSPHFNLISWLGLYVSATPGISGHDNATLRLDLDNEPQPDVLLSLEPSLGGRVHMTEDDYLEGSPEFIIEVAASSASYDMNKKKRVYARNGVTEYLVYLAYERKIYWYQLGEEGYEELQADSQGVLRSQIFPGLWLNTTALIAGNLSAVNATLQQGLASPEHETFVRHLNQRIK